MDNPACNTLPQWRAANVTANNVPPHATVARRAHWSHAFSLSLRRIKGRQKSSTVVEANEFSAAERFYMAAAKMAATIKPAAGEGRKSQTKRGYTESATAGAAKWRSE
jgi:hypothetical protein